MNEQGTIEPALQALQEEGTAAFDQAPKTGVDAEAVSVTGETALDEHGGLYGASTTEGAVAVSPESDALRPAEKVIESEPAIINMGTTIEESDDARISMGDSTFVNEDGVENPSEPLLKATGDEIVASIEEATSADERTATTAEALARARQTAQERGEDLDSELMTPEGLTGYGKINEGVQETQKKFDKIIGTDIAKEISPKNELEKTDEERLVELSKSMAEMAREGIVKIRILTEKEAQKIKSAELRRDERRAAAEEMRMRADQEELDAETEYSASVQDSNAKLTELEGQRQQYEAAVNKSE